MRIRLRVGVQGDDVEAGQQPGDVLKFNDFVRVLAHFRPLEKSAGKNMLNSREEKLRFCFGMYDLDGNNKISKNELWAILTMMVGANISHAQLNSIAGQMVNDADTDEDNSISFEEFCKILEHTDRMLPRIFRLDFITNTLDNFLTNSKKSEPGLKPFRMHSSLSSEQEKILRMYCFDHGIIKASFLIADSNEGTKDLLRHQPYLRLHRIIKSCPRP